jgi:hypothetical protein
VKRAQVLDDCEEFSLLLQATWSSRLDARQHALNHAAGCTNIVVQHSEIGRSTSVAGQQATKSPVGVPLGPHWQRNAKEGAR